MEKKTHLVITALLVGAFILAAVFYLSAAAPPEEDPEALAACLKEQGAVFYGAFWCSHCQAQKKAFGGAADSLPYVECSTPDGQGRTDACREKNITAYPTWEFADGSRLSGELDMETLAKKTGCGLP
ncbi:MAG: hypothetical protein V1867_04965 [Candidatus Falkowbacteria bacterium]